MIIDSTLITDHRKQRSLTLASWSKRPKSSLRRRTKSWKIKSLILHFVWYTAQSNNKYLPLWSENKNFVKRMERSWPGPSIGKTSLWSRQCPRRECWKWKIIQSGNDGNDDDGDDKGQRPIWSRAMSGSPVVVSLFTDNDGNLIFNTKRSRICLFRNCKNFILNLLVPCFKIEYNHQWKIWQ